MSEENTAGRRYSNSSTLSLSTRPKKLKDSTRSDKRKTSKTTPPIEAISEVAVNTLGAENDDNKQIKRFHSAPETVIRIDVEGNTTHFKKHSASNRNSMASKRSSRDEKEMVEDTKHHHSHHQMDYSKPGIHYNSSLEAGRPTIHYISGHVNHAFIGHEVHDQYQQNHMMSVNSVQREQYWSWPCCHWRCHWNWTRREKTLSFIIVVQAFVIGGLLIALLKILLSDGDIVITNASSPWKLS
ncbi:uncharacterized protein LOC119653038 isoform X2 [Hermetia illucens]|nr:uncharacterized protein LOC119653038 isoform X2 [Hermetia illucens]